MLKKKLLSSYTIPTIKAINSITSRGFPKTLPVGSFVYRIQQYPGDIDIREDLIADPSMNGISQLVRAIRTIIKQVLEDPNAYFADFKAGVDPAFEISTDPWNPTEIAAHLNDLHTRNILDTNDYSKMMELVIPNASPQQKHLLEALIRDKYVLRWSPSEVLSGNKSLPGNRFKKFEDAIQEPEIVKIDIWAWLEDRFVELSNFLILFVGDRRVNIEQGDYIESMKHDVTKYLSDFYFTPFKAFKRLWVLAVAFGDQPMMDKLNPLINSGVSIVYQVVSDLKALKDMVKGLPHPPYSKMAVEAEEMKTRLGKVYEFDIGDDIYGIINELYDLLSDALYGAERKRDPVIMILEVLITKLTSIMNIQAMRYAKRAKLLPISGQYLED